MMTKFKVGDKVIFNKENTHVAKQFDFKINEPYEVQDVYPIQRTIIIINEKGVLYTFGKERFELVETKPTKNQRITALENEVAELRPLKQEVAELKLIVHELRGKKSIEPSTTNTVEDIIEFEGQQYKKVDREAKVGDVIIARVDTSNHVVKDVPYKVTTGQGNSAELGDLALVYSKRKNRTTETVDVYEPSEEGFNPHIPIVDETIEPLTPNQQRAAIIEKAKKFVEDVLERNYKNTQGFFPSVWLVSENKSFYITHKVDFIVNEEKRSVVALIKLIKSREVHRKGIAKCNPSDVFNQHIGKAIALGRALGLDVSEFEQAVQPNEAVVGQVVNFYSRFNSRRLLDSFEIAKVEKQSGEIIAFKNEYTNRYFEFEPDKTGDKIINDTNAIY